MFLRNLTVSINEFDISDTWQCGLKCTGINLQTLQNKNMILLLENIFRGGISSIIGDRYVKSDENKKILYINANSLYGWALKEKLPHGEIKFDRNIKLEDILNTPDDSDNGCFIEVDIKCPGNIKKNKEFSICS